MLYTRFGKTDLNISVLSAGCMRSMQAWQDLPAGEITGQEQGRQQSVIEKALAVGINHIETARGYGSSERQLGRILPSFDRDSLIIQTKVAPEDDPGKFVEKVEDSLGRLGLDRVDLLGFHGINHYHSLWQVCRPGGCLAAARRLQKLGRIGGIGFSGHGFTEVITEAVNHLEDGGFDYINLHWYTIFQQHSEVLIAARQRDLGVFIISPSDKGGMLHTPSQKLIDLSKPLSPMQFNDLFCLLRPEIDTISIGATVPGDYDDHVEALNHVGDSALIGAIYNRWQDAMEETVGCRDPGAHWSAFPSWQRTPGYVNIPFIVWLDNLARGWDLHAFSRARYAMLGRETAWVPGNNAAHAGEMDFAEIAEKAGMSSRELKHRLQEAHRLLQPVKDEEE